MLQNVSVFFILPCFFLQNWRKRWFILLSSKVLEYYKSESGEQKGVINLEDCHSVNSNLFHKKYKCVFNVETKERVYFLVSKTEKEMKQWVDALCSVCGLISEPGEQCAYLKSIRVQLTLRKIAVTM